MLVPLNATSVYLGMALGGVLGSALLPEVGARALSALALIPLAGACLAHFLSSRRRRTEECASEAVDAVPGPPPAHEVLDIREHLA